jgi:hypothetical protein
VNLPRLIRIYSTLLVLTVGFVGSSFGQNAPPTDAFQILRHEPSRPRITQFLQYQLDQAWRQDETRRQKWEAIRTQQDLLNMQTYLRRTLLQMIGGLPNEKTELNARITGNIQMEGYSIEKLIYESLPGVYVTALVYAPDDRSKKHPAVLVPAGHATNGKIHYQALSQRLASRGYVVIAWDPVGQGERSQFWDAKEDQSRYNLVCAEHAVLGNLAYLAGANLERWEIWDGMRAVNYLLTRPDVDRERISISATSGGGTQTALIAALDSRIKAAVSSCYISSMPMRLSDARSLAVIVRDYYEERKSSSAIQLVEEYRKKGPSMSVEKWSVTEFENMPPGEGRISWEFAGRTRFGDVFIDKYMLRHSRLLEMPLLYIHKPSNERKDILLWFSDGGKATPGD